MVGAVRPIFVLFGSSIVQFSFSNEGWEAILADVYARKVFDLLLGLCRRFLNVIGFRLLIVVSE